MKSPLVSIIIPVYNAEKYLAETIASAMAQTWEDKEIIVVDDGSADDSLHIAQSFKGAGITILHQENKGASAARNKGLNEAKGEYIQFLDADDLLSPGKIEEQVKLLISNPGYVSLCATVDFFDGSDPYSNKIKPEWYSREINEPVAFLLKLYGGALTGPGYGGMIQPNAWLTPRAVIDKAGGWNEKLSVDDDGEFFCRVLLASGGIIYSQKGVNYYRKFSRKRSLSTPDDLRSNKSLLEATNLKARYLLERTSDSNAKLALCRIYHEIAFMFYPKFSGLALEAEEKAKDLAPGHYFQPYNGGLNLLLSKIIGWKGARYLQYLKNSVLKK